MAASPGSASSRVSGAAKFGVFAAALAFTGSPYLDGYQQRESPQSTARWISFADAGITATSPLGPKLAALMSMSNGWDDGDGLAPRLPAITRARDLANALGPHYVTSVMLNPSLEGGVMFERQIGAARWSLEIEGDGELFLIVVYPDRPTTTEAPSDLAQTADSFKRFVTERTAAAAQ